MSINWAQLYEALPNASYWFTRYQMAKGSLLGMGDQPVLMTHEEWSTWYDEAIPEDATARDICLINESKLAQLREQALAEVAPVEQDIATFIGSFCVWYRSCNIGHSRYRHDTYWRLRRNSSNLASIVYMCVGVFCNTGTLLNT